MGCRNPPTPTEPVPTEPPECPGEVGVPVAFVTHEGFSGGEDLAFDPEGGVYSVDAAGRLTRRTLDGQESVIRGGLGSIAGIVRLPDGDLVLADVLAGALLRVHPDGATETVVSGLAYPNGLALDGTGAVITSEQSDDRVSRVDLTTGAVEVLAEGLDRPNGVAVARDGSVFVGSFGGGTVTRIRAGVAEPFGDISILQPSTPCAADGDPCMLGDAPGTCAADACEPSHDAAACAGLADGIPCTTELFGATVESRCTAGFCPWSPGGALDACMGAADFASCTLDGQDGTCIRSPQELLACSVDVAEPCLSLQADDPCILDDGVRPFLGTCLDFGATLACRPPDLEPIGGGLDGLGVDVCGNVWATEFRTGSVHLWGPDGGRSTVAATLPSAWIPNLAWGPGAGGAAADSVFVMDRDEGRLFELLAGVPE